MSIKTLNPYLNYNGDAAQAIALYERALGAKVEMIQHLGDMPAGTGAPPVAEADKKRVMHARLRIGGGLVMISDCPPGVTVPSGGNAFVMLDVDDVGDLERKFDALSAGGTVTMKPNDTVWGARFGMLKDAYGVQWMMNCELKK